MIFVVRRINDDLALINFNGDVCLWTRRKARKSGVCYVTSRRFDRWSQVFGPLGNKQYRYLRVIATWVTSFPCS
jgi:hypothetical protein